MFQAFDLEAATFGFEKPVHMGQNQEQNESSWLRCYFFAAQYPNIKT